MNKFPPNHQIKIIGHKCNSLSKLKDTVILENLGVCGVEYDVVGTRDNIPFLMHDKFISYKLSNGTIIEFAKPIEVFSLTAQELKELRPDLDTLAETFYILEKLDFSKDFEFHLEIKPANIRLVENIVDILNHNPKINKQTVIRSFQPINLEYLKQINPDRLYCFLINANDAYNAKSDFPLENTITNRLPALNEIKQLCKFIPEQISINYDALTSEFIDVMHQANIEVEVYTLNDLTKLNSMKVDRVVTDYPIKIITSLQAAANKLQY
jgi:glycerophosphoryl diester phosphodiesterase